MSSSRYSTPHPSPAVSESDGQYVYRMNHKKRGLFVLINNRSFEAKTKMTERYAN